MEGGLDRLFDLGSAALSTQRAGPPPTPRACRSCPGLVRYDEVAAGVVGHAIRATFDTTRRGYIHPATHYASSKLLRARCRRWACACGCKESYYADHLADFEPGSQARPIFEALYRYGLIVADNGSNWYFTGAADPAWDDDDVGAAQGRAPGGLRRRRLARRR